MNISEVDTAIKRLSALDTYRRLTDENVKAEYMQSLMGIDLAVFNAAFAQLKATCTELPPICDIQAACARLKGQEPPPREECRLCGGKGYVEIEERRALTSDRSLTRPYAMCYRCTCQNGERWGKTFTDRCTTPPANTTWLRIDDVYPGWRGDKK